MLKVLVARRLKGKLFAVGAATNAASARHEEQRRQPGTTSARYSCLTTTLSACDARARAGMHSGMWLRMGSAGKAREGSTGHAVDDQGTWLEH